MLEELIRQYLEGTKMMHLATALQGRPWVCNVWFVSDDLFNLYWFSTATRRHSREVAENSHVAGSMCLLQTPEDAPRGLQFEGEAQVLIDTAEVEKARGLYEGRIFAREKIDELMRHPERPHKFYRIKPALSVLFDVVNFPADPRQEWRPHA